MAGLVVGAFALAGLATLALRRRGPNVDGPGADSRKRVDASDDPIVAPAYQFLDLWPADARRALFDLQKELGLDPRKGGLAGVIGHESGGDPAAPTIKSGTPRGGLIQVTQDAHMPGYESADAVWGIRRQDRVTQLRGIVRDFYKLQMPHGPPSDQSAAHMLRRNYLPGLASRPSSFVLGVRTGSVGPGGEKPEDKLAGKITLGGNYSANPGFDPAGRGWFTWDDVDRQAAKAEREALARGWIRVSGARVQPGDLPMAGIETVGGGKEDASKRNGYPDDADVFWHPWRYPPGTKVSAETMAKLDAAAVASEKDREARGESITDMVLRMNAEDEAKLWI